MTVPPWTVARQAPLSMGFSRQEYWSGLPCPPPGDLPNSGTKRRSPVLWVGSLPSETPSPVPSINRAQRSSLGSAPKGSGLPRLWLVQARSSSLLFLWISISKHRTLLLTLDFRPSGLRPDFSFHMGAVDHLSAHHETQHSHTLLHRLDASQPTRSLDPHGPNCHLRASRSCSSGL